MTYARQVDIYVSGHGGGANRNFYSLSNGLGSGGRIQDVLSGEQLTNYYSGDIFEDESGLDSPRGFLQKPFSSRALVSSLHELLKPQRD